MKVRKACKKMRARKARRKIKTHKARKAFIYLSSISFT